MNNRKIKNKKRIVNKNWVLVCSLGGKTLPMVNAVAWTFMFIQNSYIDILTPKDGFR